MRASQRRMEAITTNLANLGTHGYRHQTTATRAFNVGQGRSQRTELSTETVTDFSQGPLDRTGNPLDLALDGDGFFVVEGPRGEEYTRAGRFQTNAEGTLVDMSGRPVAWETSRGTLDPLGEAIVIDDAGHVRQGKQEVGKLLIAAFVNNDELQPVEGGAFRANPSARRIPSEARIHQGALEGSNTSGIDQMVELIQTQRAFERSANMLRMVQRSYERLIQSR